jgi:hypothetical protein
MVPSTKHRFVAIDEGLGTLLHVDENGPSRDWIAPIRRPQARDLQLVGGNRILVGHHHGYTEFDLTTGTPVLTFAELEGVTSVRRQADGSTLIAGVNLAGIEGVSILTLDAGDHHLRHRATFPGDYVRLIRQTSSGTYLMCCNDRIREGSPEGGYLREFPIGGFYHAWKAVALTNGHVMVSAGYGAFMIELDAAGQVVRRWGGKAELPAEVNPFFYAMFQILPNSHVVLANWQGHGPGLGGSGVQLIEFDASGSIVWRWSDPARISSLQGIVVLDGLDTDRLHDEREGTMRPLASSKSEG